MAGLSAMAGLGVTLELLPAPTKAVVAAALAGVAADICIASRAPAQCLSYRVPYDEDVFQVRGLLSAAQRSRDPGSRCPQAQPHHASPTQLLLVCRAAPRRCGPWGAGWRGPGSRW